jgi:hypothetical protein
VCHTCRQLPHPRADTRGASSGRTLTRALAPLALLAAAVGCAPAAVDSADSTASASLCDHPEDSVCETKESNLIAGQNIDAGTVRIDNDGEHLIVEITADAPWTITEVHIFAGTGSAPTNKKGVVVPGQFPYNTTYATGVSQHTVAIPLADLNVGCGDTLNTVVHAVVVRTVNGKTESQTAFGDGTAFSTSRWGFSSTYTVCCEPPPPPPPPPPETCEVHSETYWMASSATVDEGACYDGQGRTYGDLAALPGLVGELARAYIAFGENLACYDSDCILGPANLDGLVVLRDCAVTADEEARAYELLDLYASVNDGSYTFDPCGCPVEYGGTCH